MGLLDFLVPTDPFAKAIGLPGAWIKSNQDEKANEREQSAFVAAGSPQADGTFLTPQTGQQRAMNAFIREGTPGVGTAERGTSAWNNAFNAWAGKALELNGAYDAADRGEVSDPMHLWSDDWNLETVTNTVDAINEETEGVPLEQDLLERTMQDYIYPSLDKDKANQATFADILAGYQPAIDANGRLVNDILTEDGDTGRSVRASRELANLDSALGTMYGANATKLDGDLGNIWGAYQERLRAGDTLEADRLANLWGAYQERLGANADLEADQHENIWGNYQTKIRANDARQLEKLGAIDQASDELAAATQGNADAKLAATQIALADLMQAADTRLGSKRTAVDESETTRLGARDTALAEMLGATDERQTRKLSDLDPLLAERLNAAESQVVATSLGEQAARDRIDAKMAAQGYVGGSSFGDANLAQAAIAARQAGAQAVGAAKVANEGDKLAVNHEARDATWTAKNWGAGEGYGITSDAAAGRLAAENEAADSRYGTTDWGAKRDVGIRDEAADTQADTNKWATGERYGVNTEHADTGYGDLTWLGNSAQASEDARDLGDYADLRWISDEGRSTRDAAAQSRSDDLRWISDTAMTERNAKNADDWNTAYWGANEGLSYLDADTNRRLSNLNTPIQLADGQIDLINTTDNAGWAGLNRSLGALNWWATGTQPNEVQQAPNTVDTTGNWMSAIGPSLVNAGLSVGQANNWWQKTPAATPATTTTP